MRFSDALNTHLAAVSDTFLAGYMNTYAPCNGSATQFSSILKHDLKKL